MIDGNEVQTYGLGVLYYQICMDDDKLINHR